MKALLLDLPRLLLALAWCGAALALPASAASLQGWLFVAADIPGESADPGHPEWLDVGSLSAGGVAPLDGSTITVQRKVDKASPKLFEACVSGRVFPEVKLHLSKLDAGNPQLFWDLTLKNVRVVSCKSSGAAGGTGATADEQLILSHGGWGMTYYQLSDPTSPPVTTVIPYAGDADGDGMSDDFETQYELELHSDDGAQDADGDGLGNLDEFRLGTDPRNGSSFFRATAQPGPPGSGQIVLTWNSLPGSSYDVKFSADLAQPFEPVARVTATGETASHTVTPAGTAGFYRVEKVEEP